MLRRLPALVGLTVLLLMAIPSAQSQQSLLNLKDGMVLGPGQIGQVQALTLDGGVNSKKEVSVGRITDMNDGLRHTYVNSNRVVNSAETGPLLKIEFDGNKSRASENGTPLTEIRAMVWHDHFELFGRRFYVANTGRGITQIVQAITEITPQYVRVESLRSDKKDFEWDMRLSLSNLDSETLSRILMQNASPTKPGDWLQIVNLFSEAKRYREARMMLVKAIRKFPQLENYRPQLKQFDQLFADQLFAAAESAKDVGQNKFAKYILESINKAGLSDETQLKVDRRLEFIATDAKEQDSLLANIKDDISKLPEGDVKVSYQSLIDEISANLSPDSAKRFADYTRRRKDVTPEQRAALAISGWIYGPTMGEDNSIIVSSGVKARQIIRDYVAAPTRNDQLIEQLTKLESGSPRYVASLLANMPPPLSVPADAAVPYVERSTEAPAAAVPATIPGRYLLEIPLGDKLRGTTVQYMVQLPPEYNPMRRYPCVLTLPSEFTTMEMQINWWAGEFSPNNPMQQCMGEASRRGYIVVSPNWTEPKQPTYNYTENEHMRILAPLRDAMRRFSIDTDRVFISGHFMGGDAAWDVAWAHPDLWAGNIVIGGAAAKYVVQYWENAKYVPNYFVVGELDRKWWGNTKVWDNLLSRKQMDCIVTKFQGRGLDHFQEELPRIMDWMSMPSRVRDFARREFDARTSRAGDRFFWWFETENLFPDKLAHPLMYTPSVGYTIESIVSKEANSVQMKVIPAKTYSIYLSPEFIDFSRTIIVESKRLEPKPNVKTILEDVRRRADRQHPFWMKVDMPN